MPRYGATQSSAARSYLAALESALHSSQVQSRVFGVSIGVDVLLCCCMHARWKIRRMQSCNNISSRFHMCYRFAKLTMLLHAIRPVLPGFADASLSQ
jgi:uncharacterized membrane protein YciS (DUF1049 family)